MKLCDVRRSQPSTSPRLLAGHLLPWALALALAVSGGCTEPPRPPLRLGTLVWPPYELFFVARERGLFPPGAVDLVELRSPIDEARAFENGGLDAALLTADFALRIAERNDGCRIALVVDVSNGGDAVLARPGIERLDQLEGHTVGVEVSSLGLYVLRRAFDTEGLDLLDRGAVEIVPIDYPELAQAYRDGRVDAVVVFEPERSELIAEGANQLFDSSRIPGEIVDVLLVRDRLLDTRPGDVRALADGWFEARELLQRTPERALPIMAAREGVSEDAMRRSLSGMEIPDRAANRRLLGGGSSDLGATLERLAETMSRLRLLDPAYDPTPLLDDRLVREPPR